MDGSATSAWRWPAGRWRCGAGWRRLVRSNWPFTAHSTSWATPASSMRSRSAEPSGGAPPDRDVDPVARTRRTMTAVHTRPARFEAPFAQYQLDDGCFDEMFDADGVPRP